MHFVVDQPIAAPLGRVERAFVDPAFYEALGAMPNIGDAEVLDLGDRRIQWFATPHVPGPWEAGVLLEQVTGTMFCGDLFARGGTVPVTTTHDIVQPAIEHDSILGGTALTPVTGPTLKRLGSAAPTTLALMHGPSYKGEARQALEALAAWFDHRLARATANR